jgi:hypothetical protein
MAENHGVDDNKEWEPRACLVLLQHQPVRGEEVFELVTWACGSATVFILSSRWHPEQNIKHEFSKRRK